MALTQLLPLLNQTFYDSNGLPLANGNVYTYQAGTTTPLAAYTDNTGGTPLSNPIVLDSNGSAQIWISNQAYKLVVKDSSGNTIRTIDNVSWINPGTVTNSMLANMAQATIKGRNQSVGTGSPQDLTPAQVMAMLPAFVGDSGSGGTLGAVPAPPVGSAGAYILDANGNWVTRNRSNAKSVTGTYSILTTDQVLYFSGTAFTATLPDATAANNMVVELVHNGTDFINYTISTTGGQTIGRYGSLSLCTNGEVFVLRAANGNWQILSHQCDTNWVTDSTLAFSFYTFTCSAANATAGATYTNNGQTFVVAATISSGTTLLCSGSGTPSSSGTLTKSGGTGDSTITFSAFTGSSNPTCVKASGAVNPTFSASPSTNLVQWRRRGQFLRHWIQYRQTAGGAGSGTGDLLFPVNSLLTIDKNIVNGANVSRIDAATSAAQDSSLTLAKLCTVAGWADYNSTGTWQAQFAIPYPTGAFSSLTAFRIYGNYNNGSTNAIALGSTIIPANQIIAFNFQVEYPVSGWIP